MATNPDRPTTAKDEEAHDRPPEVRRDHAHASIPGGVRACWRGLHALLKAVLRKRTLIVFFLALIALTVIGEIDAGTSGWWITVLGALLAFALALGSGGEADTLRYKVFNCTLGVLMALAVSQIPLGGAPTEQTPNTLAQPVCPTLAKVPESLTLGQDLRGGESLSSPNRRYILTMGSEGRLSFCDTASDRMLWRLGQDDQPGSTAIFRGDGNFVVEDADSQLEWATNTDAVGATSVAVTNDGQLVLRAAGSHPVVWTSKGDATVSLADPPQPGSSELRPWQRLAANEYLRSPNGRFVLRMDPDGNLVLYDGTELIWQSYTSGHYGAALAMQHDGNLVHYANPYNPDPSRRGVLWATGTDGWDVDTFRVDDQGRLLLVDSSDVIVADIRDDT